MNIQISQPKQLPKSVGHCRLFTEITKKLRTDEEKQQKMICTKDTMKSQQPEAFNFNDFDFHFENKIKQFKMNKAEQIADISIDGEIPVKNIMKRIRTKMEKELFDYIQDTIKQMDIYEQKSAQKKTRSPKQLGSTIEHTFTPKSIQTPAFEFDSSDQRKINEFSVGSNQFTLNPKSTQEHNMKVKQQKGQLVSEFTLGSRNPTSKRIKDKIMNSKRNNY